MRVVIQQADLDTCVAALVLGVTSNDAIRVATDGATADELGDVEVLCLEAGGSGDVVHRNFDHHNTTDPLPAACRQALAACDHRTGQLEPLVAYTEQVDVGRGHGDVAHRYPTLSQLQSGVRLCIPGADAQLRETLRVLAIVVDGRLEPTGPLPVLAEWRRYLERKQEELAALARVRLRLRVERTAAGREVGFLQTECIGALGTIYQDGLEIAVAYSPRFENGEGKPIRKFTIGSRARRLDALRDALRLREPGWGGPAHGTVLGSPRTGTHLGVEEVLALVREHC